LKLELRRFLPAFEYLKLCGTEKKTILILIGLRYFTDKLRNKNVKLLLHCSDPAFTNYIIVIITVLPIEIKSDGRVSYDDSHNSDVISSYRSLYPNQLAY